MSSRQFILAADPGFNPLHRGGGIRIFTDFDQVNMALAVSILSIEAGDSNLVPGLLLVPVVFSFNPLHRGGGIRMGACRMRWWRKFVSILSIEAGGFECCAVQSGKISGSRVSILSIEAGGFELR